MGVLVIGGAGYIGSHMAKLLLDQGEHVVVLDNLRTGFEEAARGSCFVRGDFGPAALLRDIFRNEPIDAVIHFAAATLVGESVTAPDLYYTNNVIKTIDLLNVMIECDVRRIVFSSSAAVYGSPDHDRLDEVSPVTPINPYGRTKLFIEAALADYRQAYGLSYYALRYFNAAGADPDGQLGERHTPETHLIPLILQAASGRRSSIEIYGEDYDTQDGTCIRDFVHVEDLCRAHLLALQQLRRSSRGEVLNVGSGAGFSVKQIIATAREVTGRSIQTVSKGRRPGDPTGLVAEAARIKQTLGWEPRMSDLPAMIEHAWRWELQKGAVW